MTRVLVVALALLVGCTRGVTPSRAPAEPRLVVLVVIDQWPSWVFEQQVQLFTGGIGRLVREGGVVMNGELPYANTFTAPGHATLATGAPPSVHGIVGNYWFRRAEERDRPAEHDASAPLFTVGASLDGDTPDESDAASGRVLRVDGVADVLRRATSGTARSVAIGLKARSATLMAGRRPDLAIWYDPSAGGMTTSKAYAPEPPAWLVSLARKAPASRYFQSTWDAGDPSLLSRVTKVADDAPGERSEYGLGAAFPHALTAADKPARAILQTPFADELVMQTVESAIEELALGRDAVPDFLAISFGAHDYAGHDWGPDSWEVLDITLRLDGALDELFQLLDAQVGVDRWAVVMTSDHGATPVVERGRVPSARRIPPKEIERVAEQALEAHLGAPGPWVADLVAGNLYLTAKFRALGDLVRAAALDDAAAAVAKIDGVAHAGRTDRLSEGCTREKELMHAVCIATVRDEAGELYVYPKAGSSITAYKAGSAHDAPFDENRRVPILVKAPGVARQAGEGSLLQVAPTLAALLGVAPPEAAHEAPLFGINRQ